MIHWVRLMCRRTKNDDEIDVWKNRKRWWDWCVEEQRTRVRLMCGRTKNDDEIDVWKSRKREWDWCVEEQRTMMRLMCGRAENESEIDVWKNRKREWDWCVEEQKTRVRLMCGRTNIIACNGNSWASRLMHSGSAKLHLSNINRFQQTTLLDWSMIIPPWTHHSCGV